MLELFTISTREDTATQEFRYRVRIIAQEDLQRDPGDTCARVTGVEVFRLFLFRMFHLEFKSCKLQFQLFFYMEILSTPVRALKHGEVTILWCSQNSLYGSKRSTFNVI